MIEIVKKIKDAADNRTTYRVGLLQTKAYRALKNHTTKALSQHEISSVHWAFLGLLYDNKKGMRMNVAAKELGVEAPFVTAMIADLSKKNFVEYTSDPDDSRAKIICLTAKGREFVTKTETYLKQEMRPLLKGVSLKELLDYLSVLTKIIENSQ